MWTLSRIARFLAEVAGAQRGLVTRAQLVAEGVPAGTIARLVSRGTLLRVHPGVYRVGHTAPSAEATYLAAVLACGPAAVLSGMAAAWLWGLVTGRPPPPEVSCPTERRVEGIRTSRRRLHPSEIGRRRGIPVTTIPLTLLDITPRMTAYDLGQAVHEAAVKHRATPSRIEPLLARRPNARGVAALRRILRGDEPILLSRLEKEFVDLLRANGLPLPRTNRRTDGHYVDCRWPGYGLTVELDSYRFHNSRHSWEKDRRREREARSRGDDFARYTWGDVAETPDVVVREVRGLIYQR
jgi:hypothetical protein